MRPQADHGESSYQGSDRLTGRHVLITGADSGIGRAVALAFAREGADVAISYLSEDKDARDCPQSDRCLGHDRYSCQQCGFAADL
jgi:NAD(P)-dependent dehydrogenase (short-subunit alcohol dehydrogenase family)